MVAEIVFVEEPRVRNEIVFMAVETVSYERVAEGGGERGGGEGCEGGVGCGGAGGVGERSG